MTETKQNSLGTEPIGRLLLKFSVPTALTLMVNCLYNIVDQIFIGHAVGIKGVAATNVTFPIGIIAAALALLIGDGCAANVSLHLGRGEQEEADRTFANAVMLLFGVGILLSVFGCIFARQLVVFFGASPSVVAEAVLYMSIILLGQPFGMCNMAFTAIIRADGNPQYMMRSMMIGAALNVVLDPIFIFVCDWGIAGGAWATVIGQIFSFILALRYLWRFQTIHFEKESFLLDIKESLKICNMGISSSSNQIAVTVIQIIQYNSLTYYGALTKYGADIPLAACGIVMKTNAIILAIVVGISQGTQPIIGFNYGARQYHRVREAYLLAVKWNLVVSTIAFIAFQFFPQSIISLFGNGDELYFEFAVLFMRTYLFMVLVNGVQLLSSSFFTAIGKSLRGALLALTRQTFFLIPLTLLLPLRFGIMGVLLAGPVADFSAFVLSVVLVGIELKKQKKLAYNLSHSI